MSVKLAENIGFDAFPAFRDDFIKWKPSIRLEKGFTLGFLGLKQSGKDFALTISQHIGLYICCGGYASQLLVIGFTLSATKCNGGQL